MPDRFFRRAAGLYPPLLGSLFLLAVPLGTEAGGYTCITRFKALLYLALTALFLLAVILSRPDPIRFRTFFRCPERLLALGFTFFTLLSALFSKTPGTAFFGGSRQEGWFVLAAYGLSLTALTLCGIPRRTSFLAFTGGIVLLEFVCALQLAGLNPLGLYPDGLHWADANLKYSGAYLGTVGNAGLTGTVLACAAVLFAFRLIAEGFRSLRALLLIPLFGALALIGRMRISAPVLALLLSGWLALPLLVRSRSGLFRWGTVLLFAAFSFFLGRLNPVLFPCAAGAAVCAFLLRKLPDRSGCRLPVWILTVLLPLGTLLALLAYRGDSRTAAELSLMLRGECEDSFGNGRIYIWRQVLQAARKQLLLGSGPDTLSLLGLEPWVWSNGWGVTVTSAIDAAHCEYLQTLVCCGLPAALCHLGLAGCSLWRLLRRSSDSAVCLAAPALCYAVCACFGISACAAAPLFPVFLALAVREDECGREVPA